MQTGLPPAKASRHIPRRRTKTNRNKISSGTSDPLMCCQVSPIVLPTSLDPNGASRVLEPYQAVLAVCPSFARIRIDALAEYRAARCVQLQTGVLVAQVEGDAGVAS